MFFEAFFNPFFIKALIAAGLASVCGSIMGSFTVVKKLSSLSGSISHSILGGIGLFLWLRYFLHAPLFHPLHGAFLAAVFAAILIGHIHLKHKESEDSLIAMIWSLGMALGVIFLYLTPGYNSEFLNFLFGNILWTSSNEIVYLLVWDLLLIALMLFFWKKLLYISFDEEFSALKKMPVKKLYFLLLTMISVTIVLLIQTVGIILVIAFLTLPATMANIFTKNLTKMMAITFIINLIFSILGLLIAYETSLPPGAVIALVLSTSYLAVLTLKTKKNA